MCRPSLGKVGQLHIHGMAGAAFQNLDKAWETDCHTIHVSLCHSVGLWPIVLKRGCITKSDILFLVMGFISFWWLMELHVCSGVIVT